MVIPTCRTVKGSNVSMNIKFNGCKGNIYLVYNQNLSHTLLACLDVQLFQCTTLCGGHTIVVHRGLSLCLK